jgi:hypothetical protein
MVAVRMRAVVLVVASVGMVMTMMTMTTLPLFDNIDKMFLCFLLLPVEFQAGFMQLFDGLT